MTTTTTMNRRTALLGTVTLPAALAPLGLAGAEARGEIPHVPTTPNAEPDPAVTAMWEWHRRRLMEKEVLDMFDDLEGNLPIGAPEIRDFNETVVMGAQEYVNEAASECGATVPTTPAGLVATLTVAACTDDAIESAKHGHSPACTLVAALIAAERMAGVSYLPQVALYNGEKLPEDSGELLHGWMEKREKDAEEMARLREVTKMDSAILGLHRIHHSGQMDDTFLRASMMEGWSLDYVFEGVEPKFRPV